MQKHRMMLVVSVLSLASLAVGPIAMARESEARDDRGGRHEVQLNDDRGGQHELELNDDRGQMPGDLELRNGADDPAGDDRGIDAQPHA